MSREVGADSGIVDDADSTAAAFESRSAADRDYGAVRRSYTAPAGVGESEFQQRNARTHEVLLEVRKLHPHGERQFAAANMARDSKAAVLRVLGMLREQQRLIGARDTDEFARI